MCEAHDVSLETMSTVVASIQRVVADYYGPQCRQTLLTSQTGKAVITSDGFTILEALHPSHPVALTIMNAIRGCHGYTLDGCKVFLLYLNSFLRALDGKIRRHHFCNDGVNYGSDIKGLERRGMVYAGRYITSLINDVMPTLQQKLKSHSQKLYNSLKLKMSLKQILQLVCKTTLAPHYNPKTCRHFAEILMKLLADDGSNADLLVDQHQDTLRLTLDQFHLLCIKVPQRPYSQCTVTQPLLIRRDFVLACSNSTRTDICRAVVLRSSIDGSESDPQVRETFCIKHKLVLHNSLQHQRKIVEMFSQQFARNKINVFLCTEGVPSYALDIFRIYEISVISHVLEEDVNMLETLTNTVSMSSTREDMCDRNVISLDSAERVGIGGEWFIHLKVSSSCHLKHLIICAPTVGLCDQSTMMLQKALNSMLMCLVDESQLTLNCETEICDYGVNCLVPRKNDHESQEHGKENGVVSNEKNLGAIEILSIQENQNRIKENLPLASIETYTNADGISKEGDSMYKVFVIEGGGSFEVLLSKLLLDYKEECVDDTVSDLCELLRDTVMSAVNVLYNNTSVEVSAGAGRGALGVRTVLEDKVNTGYELWGLDRRGIPCNLRDKGVFEPLFGKLHILTCVLNLIKQLLKIDAVVSVKEIK